MALAIQALHGINVCKANPPSKKQRRLERAKLNLPQPKYEWYLNAHQSEIDEWKRFGIPTETEAREIARQYRNSTALEQSEMVKQIKI